jgi:hypothetical protein
MNPTNPTNPTNPMTIHLYTDADRDSWESFVEHHPNATFYHRIGWKEVMEKALATRPIIC